MGTGQLTHLVVVVSMLPLVQVKSQYDREGLGGGHSKGYFIESDKGERLFVKRVQCPHCRDEPDLCNRCYGYVYRFCRTDIPRY